MIKNERQYRITRTRADEVRRSITELTEEAVGYYAFPNDRALGSNEYPVGPDYAVGAAGRYFNMRKASIYGGSNVQAQVDHVRFRKSH